MPEIAALQRHEDCCYKFKASLDYVTIALSQKKKTKQMLLAAMRPTCLSSKDNKTDRQS